MSTCKIRRQFLVRQPGRLIAEVGDCANPLRTEHERATNVCAFCTAGYETRYNRFANGRERAEAAFWKESS